MHKKLALYPATRDICAAARHKELFQGYSLAYIFSQQFMHLDGKDVSYYDGGNFADIMFTNYDEAKLAECDVLFVDYNQHIKDLDIYRGIIDFASKMDLEVIVSRGLKNKLEDGSKKESFVITQPSEKDQLFEIRVPVLSVLSAGPYTDQYAVELAIRKYLSEMGYKVTQVGSRGLSFAFGFNSIPGFLYESGDAYGNILRFNRFVKDITEREQPDLLVMGVPGATMKYNNYLLNGIGVLPFMICSAVKSDASVLCTYYNPYVNENFDSMSMHGNYKLDAPTHFFNIANTTVSSKFTDGVFKMDYVDLDSTFVLNGIRDEINSSGHYLFNALDSESAKNACDAIIESLSGNANYLR